MHIFCMFQPPLYKNAWFTHFVGQELVRHMHFLRSPRSGKTCTPGKCMFFLHVSATSKNACCCMLLHVAACCCMFHPFLQIFKATFKKHAFSQAKYHFWWDWTLQKMHVARGPLLTLWLFPSPPLGPSPAVTGLVSLELPAHRHMYVEQPSQRTLKVAHSLWCNIIPGTQIPIYK
jgi:hypothetical protein